MGEGRPNPSSKVPCQRPPWASLVLASWVPPPRPRHSLPPPPAFPLPGCSPVCPLLLPPLLLRVCTVSAHCRCGWVLCCLMRNYVFSFTLSRPLYLVPLLCVAWFAAPVRAVGWGQGRACGVVTAVHGGGGGWAGPCFLPTCSHGRTRSIASKK